MPLGVRKRVRFGPVPAEPTTIPESAKFTLLPAPARASDIAALLDLRLGYLCGSIGYRAVLAKALGDVQSFVRAAQ